MGGKLRLNGLVGRTSNPEWEGGGGKETPTRPTALGVLKDGTFLLLVGL